eukprot:2600811-Amphidinium_carterae.1
MIFWAGVVLRVGARYQAGDGFAEVPTNVLVTQQVLQSTMDRRVSAGQCKKLLEDTIFRNAHLAQKFKNALLYSVVVSSGPKMPCYFCCMFAFSSSKMPCFIAFFAHYANLLLLNSA